MSTVFTPTTSEYPNSESDSLRSVSTQVQKNRGPSCFLLKFISTQRLNVMEYGDQTPTSVVCLIDYGATASENLARVKKTLLEAIDKGSYRIGGTWVKINVPGSDEKMGVAMGLHEIVVYLMGLRVPDDGKLVNPGLLGIEGNNTIYVWWTYVPEM